MPPEFDKGMDEAIDRFWDQVAQNRSNPAGNLDPVDMAAIRHLHAHDDRPDPNPAFTRHLREELMHAHAIQVSSNPSAIPLPNGRASRPWRIDPQPLPPSGRQRALAQLATAALLVLTVVGSFFIFGPGRFAQPEEQRGFIPAVSSTPATPETGAPIAEFVWKSEGSADIPLGPPGYPAVDPQGNLWVADGDNGRFIVLSPEGAVLETWGAQGEDEGEFDFDCGNTTLGSAVFDGAGNIYVVDSGNQRVQKFGPDRAFITSWGSAGTGDGQFLCPADLAIDGEGRIYVTDSAWGKVEVFAADGAWLSTLSDVTAPMGIAIDGDANVWVADDSGEVVMLTPDGQRLAAWEGGLPSDVAVDAEGRVFVADAYTNRIEVLSPDATSLGGWGTRGDADGEFKGVTGIALDGHGALYTVESDRLRPRAQKFRLLPPLG